MEPWLAVEMMLLREAFLSGQGSMENPEYDALYQQMMENLYQGVFDITNISTDFYEFVNHYLQDLHSGISISRPDVTGFPNVTVSVSTAESIVLTPESVILTDTKKEISGFTVEKTNNDKLSICFVLDRSGSMQGVYIDSAKQAIKSFATNMDVDTNGALVSFENSARVDCPLVDSAYMVAAQVEKISASGGTNIASGLLMGAEQLSGASGTKIIILLSDGVDGNAAELPKALNRLKQENIVVYAIGLPGCDEEYLTNIASQTDGSYYPASTTASLNAIYEEIRSFLRNTYIVCYQAEEPETVDRALWIESVDSMAQARRNYSTDISGEQISSIYDEQVSDLFRQIGGSLGGN